MRDAKALALELLAHEAPFNWVHLKQYRDAADTERACYQAAVHTKRSITRIYDIREIESRVHVRMHRLSGHPIVQGLGLKVKSVDSTGGQVVDNLQPIRPFWMRVSLREQLGTVIAWRALGPHWQIAHPWFAAPRAGAGQSGADPSTPYFRCAGETRVGRSLGQPQEFQRGLKDQSIEWLRQAVSAELKHLRIETSSNIRCWRRFDQKR